MREVPEVPNEVLRSIYESPDCHSAIAADFADALYGLVLDEKPTLAVEVGMAFGASTLAILSAMEASGGEGRLISIDPFQTDPDEWAGVGLGNVAKAGLSHRHELIEQPDYLALPELVRDGRRIEFAYLDGWHTFDYTLLDFFYVDKLLRAGGVVGFNDCHYRGVEKVASFVTRHRHYEEIGVGLAPRRIVRARHHRLIGRWVNVNDRYFRKLEEWEPDFRFFEPF